MALDATAKRNNIKMSVKKYLIDNFETSLQKTIFFDLGFSMPKLDALNEWISISFGSMSRQGLSYFNVDIILATRRDLEGDDLTALADLAFEVMTDADQADGVRRIVLYDVAADPWVQVGMLIVTDIMDSGDMVSSDKTNYQILSCRLKWVSKC